MTAIVTDFLKKKLVDLLYTEVVDGTDSNEYYIGIGKSDQYNTADTTVTPVRTLREERIARANLQSVKKVTATSFVIPRYNWSSGTIYSGFSDSVVGIPSNSYYVLTEDNEVYIRGELDKERVRYAVLRKGSKLVDPDSKEVLGYEGIYAGEVLVHTYGDPAVGKLTFTEREVLRGDKLLPTDKSKIDNLYFPRLPEQDISGKIIHLPDALFGVAKLQVAVINKGSRDGVDNGHLLATYSSGKYFKDAFDPDGKNDDIVLPDIRSGLMMVFKTFDHVSYGLILESSRVIHKNDIVRTPK